jgi:hypothetical protein
MTSSDVSDNQGRPLYVGIEMVANLLYLAMHSQESPDEQRGFLKQASEILSEMRDHPDLPK